MENAETEFPLKFAVKAKPRFTVSVVLPLTDPHTLACAQVAVMVEVAPGGAVLSTLTRPFDPDTLLTVATLVLDDVQVKALVRF